MEAQAERIVTLSLTERQYQTIMRALSVAHERARRVGATADLADINNTIAATSGKLRG
jgi:hypothetical protein